MDDRYDQVTSGSSSSFFDRRDTHKYSCHTGEHGEYDSGGFIIIVSYTYNLIII